MPSLALAHAAEDIGTFGFDPIVGDSTFRWRKPQDDVRNWKTGEGVLIEEVEAQVPSVVRNLAVDVNMKNLRFRMRVVTEKYRGQESEDFFLASWAEDPTFVVPGSELFEAIEELTSFLVDTILDVVDTPDDCLAPDALERKRRFRSMITRG
jgi:hypothetical protein